MNLHRRALPILLALPLVMSGCQVVSAATLPAAETPALSVSAKALKTTDDLLAYMVAHPEQVSLTAYPVGRPDAGIYHRADAPQSLASTMKLLVLHEYARQVSEGQLNATEKVALDDVFGHVIGRDGGAARNALDDWRKREVLDADGKLPLDEVAHAMIRYSCNASTDYLIARLGREPLGRLPQRLGAPREEAPFPLSGAMMMVGNHTTTGAPATRRAAYEKMSRTQLADTAYDWNRKLRTEPGFQMKEIEWLQKGGDTLSYDEQRRFFQVAWTRGTTRGYARVIADAYQAETPAARLMRHHLSWPMAFPGNRDAYDAMGTKGGSLPGLLTGATYFKLKSRPEAMTVALFFQDLPESVYENLGKSYLHQDFEHRLHADPAFFDTVRTRLKGS